MSLTRGEISHIEKSLEKYLETQISTDSITTLVDGAEISPEVRVGGQYNDDWTLPVIQINVESFQAPKPFIGQTRTVRTYLVIIDFYCTGEYERMNLVDYITDELEAGCDYIVFSNNVANPDAPIETVSGHLSTTFLSNQKISFGDNVNIADKFRHRITMNVEIIYD